ncbi:PAS sensor protein [Natrinema pellirubrum DSM 15624]|uniref:PAS domain S-box n=1 Tax=Natrinema pellirubrum (strain DSM 15624 / CIP 106293 / JCM 10476 / NCIMB 786 / 157) TaxID=797303 RepID=L0JJH1_NATP1|nr:bacterio-opsin activator domain-containing protein [Natrinema pellirubrum]AGB30983.1 PAS domain S-box [Natrinema pellirubrum DSM 15624]ELY80634.1 PAS sensor protein [Natrinema pellirubrum DSM 15624]
MASERPLDGARLLVVVPTEARPEPLASVLDDDALDATAVSTATAALERLETTSVDCLLTVQSLPDRSGLALLEAVREREPDLPVVLAPVDGDESVASAAIAADVSAYVPLDGSADGPAEGLRPAIERAMSAARDRRWRRDRARAFDAVFDDPEAYGWLLAPDGTVRRANEPALKAIAATPTDVRGRPFAELPWWESAVDGEAVLRDAIDAAASGEITHRELTCVRADGDGTTARDGSDAAAETDDSDRRRTFEVTVRPIRDESGTVISLFARADDVTERARLERELRESEQLHRVTLNNMTDTVLITDDDGAFTYVCPNVHFVFGYSDDEIHEMGTIDELLGPDLFDRDELEAAGVLTNIECTATDRAGREHTLLVNVREVSIQGGTTLYSCRDVTTRKRREEALTALHRTTRELLYAETDREIADIVVDDAADVLDLEASAAYLFDTDENVLRPVASSPAMERLHGPVRDHRATEDSVPGRVFVDGESRFFADVHESPSLSNPGTELRSVAYVPLGDHGVFVAGSSEPDAFDDVARELTDLLATTAEAALDRVGRERTLRERDRELERRNRQLTRLNGINEIIRDLDQALVGAETRDEIERAVCDRLTTADRFSFAWIGAADAGDDRLAVRADGGATEGESYLDSVSLSLAGGTEPAVRTATDRAVTGVANVADGLREEPWRSEALACEFQSAVSVPLSYDDFTYGVLTVYADRPDAFDEMVRTVLAELGETIAAAIAAVERKRALLSDSSTRLEFAVGDETVLFTRLARRTDCTVSFDGGVRHREDGATVVATVEGASPDAVAAAATDLVTVEGARVIGRDGADDDGSDEDAGGAVLLDLSRPVLALQLADHGVLLRGVEATPTDTRVVVDVPSSVDARGGADVVSTVFSEVELRSKRSVERTTPRDFHASLRDRLTDRQLEVVRLAYYGGYFESPRAQSGESIAETLDISPAAFYRHVRTVQRKLFAIVFDEIGLPANPSRGVE